MAQDVTLTLTPQEVLAIIRSMDRQPISETPPAGYWSVQEKIVTALRDPRARAEFDKLAAEKRPQ
ncbi:hypothetical protein AXW67_06975 [Bradyrhizobium neotropicale]|uniref:Uncharacterized protein n=1 Tax=Bradyrhizobium neotropicale TaxID=1497615 RepID=A0A176ZBU0_9BRAD|nr:hypothetical protein AXW67_06975 [Bradyrhizobium neotropicale]